MRAELQIPVPLLYTFLLVLTRIAGAIIFVPLPGVRNAPDPARIVLILLTTIALFPVWPALPHLPSMIELAGWMIVESTFGLCIGLLAGFLSDAVLLFGQMIGLHAGYSFASTIDPNTQADSPVLSSMAQTVSGLLFVTLGLHRFVIRVFAESLQTQPPGKLLLSPRWGEAIIHAGAALFSVGLRLALPIVALLLMVDITLSLLGRINSHLQITHFAMPLKMLGALAMFAVLLTLFFTLYSDYANHLFRLAASLAG